MATSGDDFPDSYAWDSLVRRSIKIWDTLIEDARMLERSFLESCTGLDDFLGQTQAVTLLWFFQRRQAFHSQEKMAKWSRDRLDDYILLPATPGYVRKTDCFFVSHFWRTKEDPDPDGQYLRLLQNELAPQVWSYIWIDWTCTPQAPRSEVEERYFTRTLETMSGIIRNCGFVWFYPPFEPRMWILYEIAEYVLTSDGGFVMVDAIEDIRVFSEHIKEMLRAGVRPTLEKYGYRCTHDRDQEFLTAWLETLILFKNLDFRTDDIRRFQDYKTWYPSVEALLMNSANGVVKLCRFEGTLSVGGKLYTFTPFPKWEGGKYSAITKRRS
ncbi:hypothetical protein ANO14919_106360 [Xylariales sp. No.14919]|nr:hypothetical protein ANO14919_106360 [Xylariales sp. No.14919]